MAQYNISSISYGGDTFILPSGGGTPWKKATWTAWYPTSTGTNYTEFSMPELANATEIICFIGSSSGTYLTSIQLMMFCEARSCVAREFDTKMLAYNSDTYNYSIAIKYDKSTQKLGYRQSFKGTSSNYMGLIEVWYK